VFARSIRARAHDDIASPLHALGPPWLGTAASIIAWFDRSVGEASPLSHVCPMAHRHFGQARKGLDRGCHGASADRQGASGTPKSKLTQFGSLYGKKVVPEGKVGSWHERHAVKNAALIARSPF